MKPKHKLIISDELHRAQSELRLPSQKSIQNLQKELEELRFSVWDDSSSITFYDILIFYKKMIVCPQSTDAFTSLIINSINRFLKSNMFTESKAINEVIRCLCCCKYQITSEIECMVLEVQILNIFEQLLDYIDKIDFESIRNILNFCIQEIMQLNKNGPNALFIMRTLEKVIESLKHVNDGYKIIIEYLKTIFNFANFSYDDNGWVSRNVAFKILLIIAENCDNEIIVDALITYSCVLVNQQLSFQDGRENFVLALRLFFCVFQSNWKSAMSPFSETFENLLSFCLSNVSKSLRLTVFEVLIDFVSQPNFVLTLFSYFVDHSYFSRLLETFLNVVSTFTLETENSAILLITTLISQLANDANRTGSAFCDAHNYKLIINNEDNENSESFLKKFNEDPKSFKKSMIEPKSLAKMIFTTRGISKDALGEFLGCNDSYCLNVLKEFINLFDFSHLDINQSIRLLLSSFRILGEGQIVDRIFDLFSVAFYKTHKNSIFENEAAVHIFSYSWLMLHTSLHNTNVMKKETFPGFIDMLKGQNNGKDFDVEFLSSIFNDVKKVPLSFDKNVQTNSPSYWELLKQQDRVRNMVLNDSTVTENPMMVIKLFREIWIQYAPIFTSLFERFTDGISQILNAYFQCASIASYYRLHDILDNLVVNICNLIHYSQKNGLNDMKSIESFKTLSLIISKHGAQIQEGWKWILELLLGLFRLDILPEEMRIQKNLCKEGKQVIIGPQMWKQSQHRNSSVSLFLKIIGSYESESEDDIFPNENQIREQREILKKCKIAEIIDNSLYFSSQSFGYFLESFARISNDFIKNIYDKTTETAICIHWITQLVIINSERIYSYWEIINDLYSKVIDCAQLNRPMLLLFQRIITSFFSLLNHFWGQEKFRKELSNLFEKITQLEQKILEALLPELLNGLNLFFSIHIVSFVSFHRYASALKILNLSFSRNEVSTFDMLDLLIKTFLESSNKPGIERLSDFYIPFIQTTVIYCIKNENDNYYKMLNNLQCILCFQGIKEMTPQMWENIFENVLFPAFSSLPAEVALQKKKTTNIIGRSIFMVKIIYRSFLLHYSLLAKLPNFDKILFKLIQYSLNLTRMRITDFNESIPELLGNALIVLKNAGIFDSEDKQQSWIDSCEIIKQVFPKFSELLNEQK